MSGCSVYFSSIGSHMALVRSEDFVNSQGSVGVGPWLCDPVVTSHMQKLRLLVWRSIRNYSQSAYSSILWRTGFNLQDALYTLHQWIYTVSCRKNTYIWGPRSRDRRSSSNYQSSWPSGGFISPVPATLSSTWLEILIPTGFKVLPQKTMRILLSYKL